MPEYKLTTADNPYSPFTEFDKWYHYDEIEKGYKTVEYLARIAEIFDDVSDEFALQLAIDDIVDRNILGIYVKITKDQADEMIERRNRK